MRSDFGFTGIGNDLNSGIVGNSGDNMLKGRASNDTLTGRGGADTFVFDGAAGLDNVDAIIDFTTGEDQIMLKGGLFRGFLQVSWMRMPSTGAPRQVMPMIV